MVAEVRALQGLMVADVRDGCLSPILLGSTAFSMAATSIWFGRVTPMTKAFTNW
jgi:hypothetical protein